MEMIYIQLTMYNNDRKSRREARLEQKQQKGPVESIITGGIFALIFGGLLFFRGDWWWLFPFFFAGISPILIGVRRLFQRKKEIAETLHTVEAQKEKEILRIAFEQGGKLTPATAALKTDLTLEEASNLLEKMTRNGHADMKILSSGIIEYEFAEFLPHTEKNQIT
jgi:hypothetical protein